MENRIPEVSPEEAVILRWRNSPLDFVKEAIGATPTNQQQQGLELLAAMCSAKVKAAKGYELTKKEKGLAEKIGISIRSGHGTGKDVFLSWVYLWLLFTYPYPRGLVTGPTSHQLDIVLWPEIRKWMRASKANLGQYIDIQADRLFMKDNKNEWFIAKRTANIKAGPEEQGETLAGLHADYMIHAVDEASGVPDGVFKPLEGAMTGMMNFAVIIGNMTRASGYFYDSHFSVGRKFWVPLHWDCEDSNIDHVTGINAMASYISRMAEKYGKDSNEHDPVLMGVDPGAGGDKSIILDRKGMKVNQLRGYNTKDTMELVGHICKESQDLEADNISVDVIGIGNGVYNRLVELRFPVNPVNVAESPREGDRFMRLRDELFWKLRE
jgi:hypothetical protein